MHGAYLGDAKVASQPGGRDIRSIDLNADLGEHEGDGYASDERLLSIISSASIACGAHAGNARVMEETARRAADLGVAVGAHPSYPDREGFGRREVGMRIGDITGSFTAQIETIIRCATRAGTAVAYVKPHGALYNRAMDDRELAESLTSAVAAIGRELAILSLPGSELEAAAQRDGLRSAREGFIDRAYESSGRLVPRSTPGAVLQEIDAAAGRAAAMALAESIAAIDGGTLRLELDSLCVHSDSARALDMVTLARRRLEEAGFTIASFAGRR